MVHSYSLFVQGTLQQFVDRLFHTVFMKYRRGCSLPPAVKFLFDLLDTQARELNLSDPEVLHTWKNNRYLHVHIVTNFRHFEDLQLDKQIRVYEEIKFLSLSQKEPLLNCYKVVLLVQYLV